MEKWEIRQTKRKFEKKFEKYEEYLEPKKTQKYYNCKIKKAGNTYVLSKYEKSVNVGSKRKELDQEDRLEKFFDSLSDDEKKQALSGADDFYAALEDLESEHRKKRSLTESIKRAKKRIMDLVNANAMMYKELPKFLTLTFAEEIEDIEKANYEFQKFIKRLNYEIYGEKKARLKYVAVPEIQWERHEKYNVKVWHFHIIFFNAPYMYWKKVLKIWKNGSIYIEGFIKKGQKKLIVNSDGEWQVKDEKFNSESVKNIGMYIAKCLDYCMKEFDEESIEKLNHKKNKNFYLASKGLFQPQIFILDFKQFDDIKDFFDDIEKVFHNETLIESEHLGDIFYFIVTLNARNSKKFDVILAYLTDLDEFKHINCA